MHFPPFLFARLINIEYNLIHLFSGIVKNKIHEFIIDRVLCIIWDLQNGVGFLWYGQKYLELCKYYNKALRTYIYYIFMPALAVRTAKPNWLIFLREHMAHRFSPFINSLINFYDSSTLKSRYSFGLDFTALTYLYFSVALYV